MTLRHWIDLPPLWLIAALAIAKCQSTYASLGLGFGPVWADFAGGLLVGGGVLLMALAVYEMRRQQTPILPHQNATHLVQSGIFSRSRNPIYLGDVMVLAGFILAWDAVLSLPMIPLFLWVLERRFVIPEEDRLRRKFRADFARYCEKTRRWI